MRIRFTLTHSVLGTVEIQEPDGWADCVLKLERDKDFHSLIEYFEGSFIFYGTAYEFINDVDNEYGFDAELQIDIDITFDEVVFESVFSGQLDLSESVKMVNRKIQVPIIRNDFWSKFINRLDTPVNIQSSTSVDGDAVEVIDNIDLTLLSQVINEQSQYTGHSGDNNTLDDADLATTGPITLSGHQVIDTVMTTDDMRVVVKDQSAAEDDGVYIPGSGAWTRATDANTGAELEGAIIFVTNGSTNKDKAFKQYADPVTIGTTPLDWQEYNYVDDYVLIDYPDESENWIPWVDYPFDFYISATVDPTIDEIQNTYTIPVVYIPTVTTGVVPDGIFEQIEITDGFGDLELDAEVHYSFIDQLTYVSTGSINGFYITAELWLQKNEDTPILIDGFTNFFPDYATRPQPLQLTLNAVYTIEVNTGDRIKLYSHFIFDPETSTISGTWRSRKLFGGITSETVTFNFKSKKANTTAQSFLLHDVGSEVSDRIIGQNDTFYSEYLGSPNTVARAYIDRGCGANYVLVRGLQLRQYTLSEKPFFQSFNQWWNGINPILNLGLGYENVAGNEVIRVEEKSHFYDPDIVFYFSNVQDISRTYDSDYIFKNIKAGYRVWQAEEISGLDDPQTKRTYSPSIKRTGTDLNIESEFIAASLAIEQTRRKTREKSADYKFDENTFIISVRDGAGQQFQPELSEDFSLVTNLNNPDERYNLRITPARNFVRWLNYVSGAMQKYLSQPFKFSSGEGNYDMSSVLSDGCPGDYNGAVLSEKQNISPTTDFLFLPELFEITVPLDWDDYKIIRDNRKNAIGVSQTQDNHIAFFIKELEYQPVKGTAIIRAWPVNLMAIDYIPSDVPIRDCIPPALEGCVDAYLTEFSQDFITEAGECLILN